MLPAAAEGMAESQWQQHAQADLGFVDVRVEPAPSPQMPPPARARGEGGAPTMDPLASFLMGSGITESDTVADVLRCEQVHDPGSFLALDADDVIEVLVTAKAKGVSVGDRAKLKALIRASGNMAVPETPRPSPRQPAQGIASLRAHFDTAAPERQHEQQPPVPLDAPAAYSQAPPPQAQQQPPPVPLHAPPAYGQAPPPHAQQQPPPPTTPTAQWQAPPRTPYPAQQSPQPPTPPPRDHGPWPPEPAPAPAPAPAPTPAPAPASAPARNPRSPFRNPFAGTGFAQANGFFEALLVMLGPARSGAADFLDAMVLKYVKPVLDGRGFESWYGGSSVANVSARQSWINSTLPRLLLFYGIFRGFVAMTTRVDSMMAFFIGFFLRKRDAIAAPPEQQRQSDRI